MLSQLLSEYKKRTFFMSTFWGTDHWGVIFKTHFSYRQRAQGRAGRLIYQKTSLQSTAPNILARLARQLGAKKLLNQKIKL